MDRALQANVITKSGKAVETAGDIDVLLLDKTGTITLGNRKATRFYEVNGIPKEHFTKIAFLSSFGGWYAWRKVHCGINRYDPKKYSPDKPTFIKFTAETRCSGIDLGKDRIRKGATDAIKAIYNKAGNELTPQIMELSIRYPAKEVPHWLYLKMKKSNWVINYKILSNPASRAIWTIEKMGIPYRYGDWW